MTPGWTRVVGVLVCALALTWALDNGLARTPPLGWLSWERFECNTDCESDPDSCIGERLLMQIADAMVTEGYRDVGYRYVTVDDCWLADTRDSHDNIRPDPRRFPSGMKALADYMHARGLRLGVYLDIGRHTCAGCPGSQGHLEQDAKTLAAWGVDMLKFDGCNTDQSHYDYGYPAMAKFLNQTGRHIMYSCEWPIYTRAKGNKPDYEKVAEACNTFRVYGDIYDSWQSITSVVNWYADDPGNFSKVTGPGRFADGDMVTVGDYGLSHDQERSQMAMWAIFASQILLSVDLRQVAPQSKALLQHKRLLAINQDKLGRQGHLVTKWYDGTLQIWLRWLSGPLGGSPALKSAPEGNPRTAVVGFLYMKEFGYPLHVSARLGDLGLINPRGYNLTEVFGGGHVGEFKPNQNITCTVNPTGIYLVEVNAL